MHWFPFVDATSSIKKVLHVHEAIAIPSPPDHLILFISQEGHSFTEHTLQVLETEAASKAKEPQTTTTS